jgi:hypothetical protein
MTDTIYSGSVTDFRRDLVHESGRQHDVSHSYREWKPGTPQGDAWAGALMAANYSYALAAVLAVAEREFGHEVAARLACKADDILTNGDGAALNADVTPDAEAGGE